MYVCIRDAHDYCLGVTRREGRLGDNGIALWGCGLAWQQQPSPPIAPMMAASEKSKTWGDVISGGGVRTSGQDEHRQRQRQPRPQPQSSSVQDCSGSTSGSGSGSRRHLSRAITQPRGLYEAVIDTYGPVTAPDGVSEVLEAVLVEEAYQSLHASDFSDAGTCSSHEDDGTAQDDRCAGVGAGAGAAGAQVPAGGRSKARGGKNRPPRLSDEEWAKSILTRKTGYGCTQRNQVLKYISQLEAKVDELQTKISKLSPQVELLDQYRWILQGENTTLKQKVSELSQTEQQQDDESLAFQEEEMQLLRIRDQQPQKKDAAGATISSKENADSNFSTEAAPIATIYPTTTIPDNTPRELEEDRSNYHESSSYRGTGRSAEHPSTPLCRNEPLRIHSNASNSNSNISSSTTTTGGHGLTQRREDQRPTTNPSLVKWPSTLYRSVSAIRKDFLELAIQDRP